MSNLNFFLIKKKKTKTQNKPFKILDINFYIPYQKELIPIREHKQRECSHQDGDIGHY